MIIKVGLERLEPKSLKDFHNDIDNTTSGGKVIKVLGNQVTFQDDGGSKECYNSFFKGWRDEAMSNRSNRS
jgi:hypothetical protein